MRHAFRWFVAALAVLLAGVLVDTARAASGSGLRHAFAPYLPSTMRGAAIQAAVLLQRADCSGNLRMLDLLQHDGVRPNMRLAVIWFVGPASDTTAIRQQLPHWTSAAPLRPAPREVLEQLRALGHVESPTLIVLDQDGRVRLTTRSPRSLREFAGLLRIVEGLTWIEEL
jgi:hypothetical protein